MCSCPQVIAGVLDVQVCLLKAASLICRGHIFTGSPLCWALCPVPSERHQRSERRVGGPSPTIGQEADLHLGLYTTFLNLHTPSPLPYSDLYLSPCPLAILTFP